jgi:RND family efflux transporter MFP subunit
MKLLRRRVIPVLIVIAAVLLFVYFTKPKEMMAALAAVSDVQSSVEVTGKLYGAQEVTVYSEITGKILTADFAAGDVVHVSDLLAAYDTKDLERAAAAAVYQEEYCQNGYASAVEENEKNTKSYQQAVLQDAEYQKQYDDASQQIKELDLSRYTQNLEIQQTQEELQKQILELNREIAEKTTELSNIQLKITLATFQASEWSMKYLENQGEEVQNQIAQLNEEVIACNQEILALPQPQMDSAEYERYLELTQQITDISRDWAQAKTDKATAQAKLLNENAIKQLENSRQIAAVQSETAAEDLKLAQAGVVSENDGIITQSYIETGCYVTKGSPLFTIQTTGSYKVTVEISKYDIENIEIGQQAVVTIGSRQYAATVDKIHYVAVTDSSDHANVKVDVRLDSPDENMIIGLEADVTIITNDEKENITIPSSALYSDDEGDYCYVISNSRLEKRYLSVGLCGDGAAAVTQGLSEGELVAVDSVTDADIGAYVHGKVD